MQYMLQALAIAGLMARKKLTCVTGLPGLQGGSNAALNAGRVAAPRHTP